MILEIKNLTVNYKLNHTINKALDDVNLAVYENEVLGIVGESGSGKTTLGLSLTKLLPKNARIERGEVIFEGKNLLEESTLSLQEIRGAKISYIFQEPTASLDPVFTIGEQLAETIIFHQKKSSKEAVLRAVELLKTVRFQEGKECLRKYPHELSGGMNQRVMIAIALSSEPKILIADEPTTALDVITQAEILNLLIEVKSKFNLTIVYITHNLNNIKKICGRIAIMREGRIIEEGSLEEIFLSPKQIYTKELISSLRRYDIRNK